MIYRCFNCGAEYKSKSSFFRFMNSDFEYNNFCHACFRKVLVEFGYGDMAIQNMVTKKMFTIDVMPVYMLRIIEEQVEVERMNECLRDPEKLAKAQKSFLDKNPEIKEMLYGRYEKK